MTTRSKPNASYRFWTPSSWEPEASETMGAKMREVMLTSRVIFAEKSMSGTCHTRCPNWYWSRRSSRKTMPARSGYLASLKLPERPKEMASPTRRM